MNFLRSLFGLDPGEVVANLAGGHCPNCWGTQEYGNSVREKERDLQVDVNNRRAKHGFVRHFVVTHLDGIKMRNVSEGPACLRCDKL